MLYLRSLAFNTVFYLNLVVFMLGFAGIFFLPRRHGLVVVRWWARSSLFWMRTLAGIRFELRGRENLPDGPCIVGAKHQSAFETFALLDVVEEPVFILKRELTFLPIFGWYLKKFEMIPVDRGKGRRAIEAFMPLVREAFARGRQLLIFPEGTRTRPGSQPRYKIGVGHIYERSGVPCVPVALNSGLYWPRRGFRRYPGTIVVEILPAIPPGFSLTEFMTRLQDDIEAACERLYAEAEVRDGRAVHRQAAGS